MDNRWATIHRILKLSIVFVVLFIAQFTATATASQVISGQGYKPVGPTEYRVVEGNGVADAHARRRLAPFQLCLLCKCCAAGPASICTTMPCCFGIDCQLPNKPFGVCAFVPKTCNCNSCAA
ncbi:hypothetical protein PTKIN_Ptkin17bG0000600 [Pterospermum kingtungense]